MMPTDRLLTLGIKPRTFWQGVEHSNNFSPNIPSHLSSQTRQDFILSSKRFAWTHLCPDYRAGEETLPHPHPYGQQVCRRLRDKAPPRYTHHNATFTPTGGRGEQRCTRDSLVDFRYLFFFHSKDLPHPRSILSPDLRSRSQSCSSRRLLLWGTRKLKSYTI